MLEKPVIDDQELITCIRRDYGLNITEINFLPISANFNAAAYRAESYFIKLYLENLNYISLVIPRFLHDQNISEIVCPIPSLTNKLSTKFNKYHIVIYQYIDGKNGFDVRLTKAQWDIFGRALRCIHNINLPDYLVNKIKQENFSSHMRNKLHKYKSYIRQTSFTEPIAKALVRLLVEKQSIVDHLIKRASELAEILKTQKLKHVLCHTDIHQGNILVGDNNQIYIVDWDQPMLAPKERDLMFIGGGVGGSKYVLGEEEAWFYDGYGEAQINKSAIAYYRYERIITDIVEYCDLLLLSNHGGEDREASLRQLKEQFMPGNVIEIACLCDV